MSASKRKLDDSGYDSDSGTLSRKLTKQLGSDINWSKCILCQDNKYTKQHKFGEPLSDCTNISSLSQFGSDNDVLHVALGHKQVEKLAKYHRSCYKLKCKAKGKENGDKSITTDKEEFQQSYDHAFQLFCKDLEKILFKERKTLIMTEAREMFIEHLAWMGINSPNYRTEKLRKRIQSRYSEQINFERMGPKHDSEVIMASDLKMTNIIKENMKLEKEQMHEPPGLTNLTDVTRVLYHTAHILHSSICSMKDSIYWPPKAQDLSYENWSLPTEVYNFLAWMISPDAEPTEFDVQVPVCDKLHGKIMSIAQDLVHVVTRGRIKTPKHVALPVTVKHLTGSEQVITLLNKFGHGLSYSAIQEIDCGLAIELIESIQAEVTIPSNIKTGIPTHFVFDNNDFANETLSGEGTVHITTGLAIQNKMQGCALPASLAGQPNKPNTHARSVKMPQNKLMQFIPECNAKMVPFCLNPLALTTETGEQDGPQKLDFVWFLLRLHKDDNDFFNPGDSKQIIPGWTPFNAVVYKGQEKSQSVVGHCQPINHSPTDNNTVYTILRRCIAMSDEIGQKDVVVSCDQAIFSRVWYIIMSQPREMSRIVPRMGEFHLLMNFEAIIGKRFADAGLFDILVESGIVAEGSVSGVLSGSHYNRTTRSHTIVSEALRRLLWDEFEKLVSKEHPELQRTGLSKLLTEAKHDLNWSTIQAVIESKDFAKIYKLFGGFCAEDRGPTFKLWISYLEMVGLLLTMKRSIRTSDFKLSLDCVRCIIPWMFSYGHTNYSRYLPIYWALMYTLPETHPEANQSLSRGDMSVQLSNENPFGQISMDKSVEMLANRPSKVAGGIRNFSCRESTVERWMATYAFRSATALQCHLLAGSKNGDEETQWSHKEGRPSRISRDEKDVQKVLATINSSMINPFKKSPYMIGLSTGIIANDAVQTDLLKAKEKGTAAAEAFVAKRLVECSVALDEPIPKMNLKTFTDMYATNKVNVGNTMIQIRREHDLFARMLVIAEQRHFNIQELLKYELGTLPMSIARDEDIMVKAEKSQLANALLGPHSLLDEAPPCDALIVDLMFTVHHTKNIPNTFGSLATSLLASFVNFEGNEIHIIADTYQSHSIKTLERRHREIQDKKEKLNIIIQNGKQKCPKQWGRFLRCNESKESLVNFLFSDWQEEKHKPLVNKHILFLSHAGQCTKVSYQDDETAVVQVPCLYTEQEEADTRCFLHAQFAAARGASNILVKTNDTDCIVLAAFTKTKIKGNVYLDRGNHSIVDVTAMADGLGQGLCDALPGIHALTGCDTVSSFYGHGKKSTYHKLIKNPKFVKTLTMLGCDFTPSIRISEACEEIVCGIYGASQKVKHVNSARYELLCKNPQACLSQYLPPTEDALELHVKRACYQAAIWRSCLEPSTSIPDPVGHGWRLNGKGELEIQWTSRLPAPKAILELISCSCAKSHCNNRKCSCKSRDLKCTKMCKCCDCTND